MPQEEIAALLTYALQQDSSGSAAGYLHKFREEFAAPRAHGPARLDASGAALYQRGYGRVRAGVGYDTAWTGARPQDDESHVVARARTAIALAPAAAALAVESGRITELQLVLASSVVGVWVGRRELGYSSAHGGGILLDTHRFDALGIFLARPWKLPLLGPVRFETHLAKIDNVLNLNGEQNDVEPFFWSARAGIEPHARFRLGVNRAMIFGGEGNYPVTAARVFKNLLGIYTSNDENSFANNMVSVDARYRLPSGGVPANAYIEWGSDDASGGWWHVPAIVGGIELGPFQRADAAFGVERAHIARNGRSNSLWYQNAWLRGGWTDDGELLGHPLAGEGDEWRAFVSGGSALRAFSGEVSGYTRERGSQNLYAPERVGRTIGAAANLDVRVSGNMRMALQGDVERGDTQPAWTMSRLRAQWRLIF